MNISLTPHLESLMKTKVESGLYNSVTEVMCEALRHDIQEGLDSGKATPLDMDAIKARGRARLAAQESDPNLR